MKKVNIIAGPPKDRAFDNTAVEHFMRDADIHIAMGGITSRLVCAYLGEELILEPEYCGGGLMTYGRIGDVIAMEGVITLNVAAKYLSGKCSRPAPGSGCDKIIDILLDADEVEFVFGTACNPDHEGDMTLEHKENSIDIIKAELEKLGKKVDIFKY